MGGGGVQLYAEELVEPLLRCMAALSRPDSLVAIAIYNRKCAAAPRVATLIFTAAKHSNSHLAPGGETVATGTASFFPGIQAQLLWTVAP